MIALLLLLQEPLSPEEALKSFRVPPGFRVELVAAEPDIVSPVALAFDEDGRLYVAEMRGYPRGETPGTIRRLEDRDGDGRMDAAVIFARDVAFPSGLLPWKGGVFVTCAYEVLYLKDVDGDGRADERRTVFSGFGRQNAQHVVNGLQLGIDNWIYGSNGLSGGTVGGVALRSDFRVLPDTGRFEAVAGSSQFGNTFDDWGRRFIVRHDNHILHPVLPLEAARRQPHVPLPPPEEAISDHGAIPRLFPASPRDAAFTTDTDSSCALTIYRGAAFPPEYRGNAFVCEPVLNLVHRDVLRPRGASFTASRADAGRDFLASTDLWSRPVNLLSGPDGALYVCDMYRRVIEHPDYIPKDIQKTLDLRAGADRGRIYRVVHGAAPRRPRLSGADLVAALEDADGWRRSTAQRLLLERRDPAAVEPLRALARGSASALGRLHALWTLEGLSALRDEDVLPALEDPDAGVREHAIRLAEPRRLETALLARVDDPAPRVRFQLVLTLGAIRSERTFDALVRLTPAGAADPWMRAALLSSAGHEPSAWLAALKRDAPAFLEGPAPGALELVRALAQAVGAERNAPRAEAWLREVAGGGRPRAWQREALACLGPLRRTGMDALVAPLAGWASAAREALEDVARPADERVEALRLLAALAPADFGGFVRATEPRELQVAAVRASPSPKLLERWAGLSAPVRREILSALLARPDGAAAVLDRLEGGAIRAVELDPALRADLLRHPDAALRARAKPLLVAKGSEERDDVIRGIEARMAGLKGDVLRGEKVFRSNCATCHRRSGQGIPVGPDLEGVAGRDPRALLIDLLDPNRAMDPSYQVYVLRTTSNETLNGILASESPAAVTLRRAGGEESVVPRRDIAELKAWPASLMPEGIENNVSPADFADLLEFLRRR